MGDKLAARPQREIDQTLIETFFTIQSPSKHFSAIDIFSISYEKKVHALCIEKPKFDTVIPARPKTPDVFVVRFQFFRTK